MVAHNNLLPNQHFRKQWKLRVKTWFNQPGQKKARRVARAAKAAQIAPRPVDGLLRPAVRCPTVKYNRRIRAGKGFTLDELKAAGIHRKKAATIGIAVDFRRKSRSEEALALNVQRLKTYKSKLVLFPKKGAKAEAVAEAVQLRGAVHPIVHSYETEAARAITAEEKEFNAYVALRKARTLARYHGIRAKRAAAKAAAEADAKK
ncbi:60S ribosomal protein L13 [Blastocladiella emersonii ATCC 22665]|nr:60S ribosomal protein L13 [Blastocladiella emersonii ATCC 22665]